MIVDAIVAVGFLALPAAVPVAALVGLRPAMLFLLPLVGALLAAVATVFELAVGGSFLTWFIVLGVLGNVAAAWRLWRGAGGTTPRKGPVSSMGTGRGARSGALGSLVEWSPWSWLVVLAVIGTVAWSLQDLRGPYIFSDGYAIWVLHSVFIYGGHQVLLSDLQNPLYAYSHPEYPPLVPAGGALAFVSVGSADLRLAVIVTSVLNACGLGVVACGIVEVARRKGPVTRLAALGVACVVCLVGFGLAGVFAVGDYADLLWAAGATAALVFGLVLPRAPQHLAVAWLCGAVASLTKDEGLTTALLIFVLVSIRYLPAPRPRFRPTAPELDGAGTVALRRRLTPALRVWAKRAGLVVVMAAPGLAWAALVRFDGLEESFFVGPRTVPIWRRWNPTIAYLTHDLHILPIAAAVAIVGSLTLRARRTQLGLAHPGLLWIVVAGYVVVLGATYLIGRNPIHHWLSTSASRTTIFANLALYTDLAIWLVVAVSGDDRLQPGEARAPTA